MDMSVDREQDSHEAAVVPKKRPLVMPDVANESLTPGGKHKRKHRTQAERDSQIRRYEETVELRVNEVMPTGGLPEAPNRKERKRPIIGIDND